jgi:hypothetical protein
MSDLCETKQFRGCPKYKMVMTRVEKDRSCPECKLVMGALMGFASPGLMKL